MSSASQLPDEGTEKKVMGHYWFQNHHVIAHTRMMTVPTSIPEFGKKIFRAVLSQSSVDMG